MTNAELDLRLVRCFVVVATHRHFGRAATELHLTQSSLSRQIRRLEQGVGARLLDRSPQGTALTEAGAVFLPLARSMLAAAAKAVARTRAAADPSRVTIGFTTNIIVTPAVRELRRRHPDAEIATRHLNLDEPRAALLDHRVDAVVTRLPLAPDGLHVTILYDEPRALLLPADHRLAGRRSVTLADIADEPVTRAADPEWDAFWRIDPRPDGSPAPDGPYIESVEDKIELVAAGAAVAIVPVVNGIEMLRADLTVVPLDGVEPSHVVLATRAGDRNRLVADFAGCARTLPAPPKR
ncbi:LysR family transcriptional regulator [Actinocatenispora thailandica]|uniref:LysR family transcriptional regulator n=1 Tax=Actinocatenispora thailandica TaxID=227318 RepID=A0A7R7DU58_9ACTN|nr:LysR substrate-binding domain-containing protein [Actinocatenispora thailandica]BCJ37826.1 LysR family transcriptional regulator [Actinocatenispora thailandica]